MWELYRAYVPRGTAGMDLAAFLDLCNKCGLVDDGCTWANVEQAFAEVMMADSQLLDFPRLMQALQTIADRKGVDEESMHSILARAHAAGLNGGNLEALVVGIGPIVGIGPVPRRQPTPAWQRSCSDLSDLSTSAEEPPMTAEEDEDGSALGFAAVVVRTLREMAANGAPARGWPEQPRTMPSRRRSGSDIDGEMPLDQVLAERRPHHPPSVRRPRRWLPPGSRSGSASVRKVVRFQGSPENCERSEDEPQEEGDEHEEASSSTSAKNQPRAPSPPAHLHARSPPAKDRKRSMSPPAQEIRRASKEVHVPEVPRLQLPTRVPRSAVRMLPPLQGVPQKLPQLDKEFSAEAKSFAKRRRAITRPTPGSVLGELGDPCSPRRRGNPSNEDAIEAIESSDASLMSVDQPKDAEAAARDGQPFSKEEAASASNAGGPFFPRPQLRRSRQLSEPRLDQQSVVELVSSIPPAPPSPRTQVLQQKKRESAPSSEVEAKVSARSRPRPKPLRNLGESVEFSGHLDEDMQAYEPSEDLPRLLGRRRDARHPFMDSNALAKTKASAAMAAKGELQEASKSGRSPPDDRAPFPTDAPVLKAPELRKDDDGNRAAIEKTFHVFCQGQPTMTCAQFENACKCCALLDNTFTYCDAQLVFVTFASTCLDYSLDFEGFQKALDQVACLRCLEEGLVRWMVTFPEKVDLLEARATPTQIRPALFTEPNDSLRPSMRGAEGTGSFGISGSVFAAGGAQRSPMGARANSLPTISSLRRRMHADLHVAQQAPAQQQSPGRCGRDGLQAHRCRPPRGGEEPSTQGVRQRRRQQQQ